MPNFRSGKYSDEDRKGQ